MDSNFENLQNQQGFSIEQQQQVCFEQMQQMQVEEKKGKKGKNKKLAIIGIVLGSLCFVALLIGNIYVFKVMLPENAISDAAISDSDISYVVNEDNNAVREEYLEKIDTEITNFAGDNDINDEKIQKALYRQGKRAFKEEAYIGAIHILEKCAEYDGAEELLNEANYKAGLLYEENKSFIYAVNCFNDSNGFSDAADRAIDCYYQAFLSHLNDGNYLYARIHAETSVLDKLDNENVRKAYLWCLVRDECNSAQDKVEAAVYQSCKDPSSYVSYGSKCYFTLSENTKSSTHCYLSIKVNHTYSATNSFGGRIKDSFSYTTEKEEFSLQGMTYDEAYRVASLSCSQLMSECGYKG